MSKCKNGHNHWTDCGLDCVSEKPRYQKISDLRSRVLSHFNIEDESVTDVLHIDVSIDFSVYSTNLLIVARRSLYTPVKQRKIDRMVSQAFSNDWTKEQWEDFENACKESL